MLVRDWVWSGVSDLFVQLVSELLDVTSGILLKYSTISGCLVGLGFQLLDIFNRNCLFCLGLVAFLSRSCQYALTNWFFKLSGLLYANMGCLSCRPDFVGLFPRIFKFLLIRFLIMSSFGGNTVVTSVLSTFVFYWRLVCYRRLDISNLLAYRAACCSPIG